MTIGAGFLTKCPSSYSIWGLTTMCNMILLLTFTASAFLSKIVQGILMQQQKLEIVSLSIKV